MAQRSSSGKGSSKSKPWNRQNPKPPSERTHLTEAEKDRARARAKKAGRRYPNLVDNMAVAKKKNASKKKRS